ncbi:MAG: F0F1 ATP synthase subunit A [Candidatus Poribacteria bacterium]|nr:F0F1 ATP synthase subunit A [Candidatus Poribacteria bacterium]
MTKAFSLLLSIFFLSTIAFNVGITAETAHDAHGEAEHEDSGGEHLHYSWLHPLSKIIPVPTPTRWQQPDLILNAYFVVLIICVFFILVTRKMKRIPEGKGQTLLELFVGGLIDFFGGILGEHGRKYVPFVGSYFIFILFLNYLGLIPGFQSPTADLNTTLALGVTALIGVQIIAIKENGVIGYLKHFVGDPLWLGPLMFPLHIIGEFARAGSLAIRLFGNIFGEESVIIKLTLLGLAVPAIAGKIPWLPIQVPMMFFGLFGGFLQALVFSMLTSIYIVTFLDHGDEGHGTEAHH